MEIVFDLFLLAIERKQPAKAPAKKTVSRAKDEGHEEENTKVTPKVHLGSSFHLMYYFSYANAYVIFR